MEFAFFLCTMEENEQVGVLVAGLQTAGDVKDKAANRLLSKNRHSFPYMH